ncbi:MAG TPA: hypothetical protein VHA37_03725, partial [Candidatus Saccharimonadales bacterium]|nr:hypothetical protein [Candidatus Saccharimonadales bacterium]
KGMNRLLLTSVSVIGISFASAALAAGGGSVYLTQTGDQQIATIDQSYGSGDQVGSSGSPFLQQNGSGTGSNVLRINQNAATNSELPNLPSFGSAGSGNSATGYQSGTSNTAEIDQEGNNSSVHLEQSGAHNGWTGPGVSGDPWYNSPFANIIVQDPTASYSSIDVRQTSDANAVKGNFFSIGQGGFNNHVTVNEVQASSGDDRNDLWIRQGTSAPDLWWAGFSAPSGLSNSTINVTQSIGPGGHVNYAALAQGNGSGNQMVVGQYNGYNNVDAQQIGSGNYFNSTQINTGTGWNFVGGEQGFPDTPFVNPLTSSNVDYRPILQSGTGNSYTSYQYGTDLWAFGSQVGNYNFLNSVQTGNNNSLFTSQLGDYNQIYASQSDSFNTAIVMQNNSSSLTSVTQSGSNNMATITQ